MGAEHLRLQEARDQGVPWKKWGPTSASASGERSRGFYGGAEKFQTDTHWRDYLLFNEYFHGDNGGGIGASHQTGWTGLVARLIHGYASLSRERVLERGLGPAAFLYGTREERARVK
jgi:hypothetical protein